MKTTPLLFLLLFIGLSLQRLVRISDCAELVNLLSRPQTHNYYELANNIYCQGIITSPIPSFSGILDGRSYAIIGLTVNCVGSRESLGLFSSLKSGAVVKNLYFIDCTVQGNEGAPYNAGMLAGEADCRHKACSITNVHVKK